MYGHAPRAVGSLGRTFVVSRHRARPQREGGTSEEDEQEAEAATAQHACNYRTRLGAYGTWRPSPTQTQTIVLSE